jgi:proteasome activator subunit 4
MTPAQQQVLGSKYLAMANAKLPRKLAAAADSATAIVSDLMAFRDYKAALAKAIRRRYAGISGVSAVVRAHPFDVPPYLPELLSALSKHVSDPQPVSSAVRKVFTEFKHTHQDNWDKHQLAFTPDQLTDLVELLVSAHYYA